VTAVSGRTFATHDLVAMLKAVRREVDNGREEVGFVRGRALGTGIAAALLSLVPASARAGGTLTFDSPGSGTVTGTVTLGLGATAPSGERVTAFSAVLESTDPAAPGSRTLTGTTAPVQNDHIDYEWKPERSGTYRLTATVETCTWLVPANGCDPGVEPAKVIGSRNLVVELPEPAPVAPAPAPTPSPSTGPTPEPAVTTAAEGAPSVPAAGPPPMAATPPTLNDWFAPTLSFWAPHPRDAQPPVQEPQSRPAAARSPDRVLAQTAQAPPQGPKSHLIVGAIFLLAAGRALIRARGATEAPAGAEEPELESAEAGCPS
jgi:hypothetical protein